MTNPKVLTLDKALMLKVFTDWHADEVTERAGARKYARRLLARLCKDAKAKPSRYPYIEVVDATFEDEPVSRLQAWLWMGGEEIYTLGWTDNRADETLAELRRFTKSWRKRARKMGMRFVTDPDILDEE